MATEKGSAPAPLDPKTAARLLDLLSTDNAFRRLFKKDAAAALAELGYQPAPGATSIAQCLQLQPGVSLAPKAKLLRDRAKIESTLNSVVSFACTDSLSAD